MEARSLEIKVPEDSLFGDNIFPDLERAVFRMSPHMLTRQDILFVSNKGTDATI